jgi:hypothetical protein
MTDFTLFICGIVVTLIAGMGVITSQVFLGYHKFIEEGKEKAIKYKHKIELENKVLEEA